MQGNGSLGHIGGELFKQAAGIDIVHVPYRGAAPAIQDLIAGHVTMLFDIVPLAMPQLAGSKVRALAVTSPQRVVTIPDVATMTEAGLSEVEGGPWFGLLVPAGTPRAVIDWLNRETKKASNASDAAAQFIAQGLVLPLRGFRGAHFGGNDAMGQGYLESRYSIGLKHRQRVGSCLRLTRTRVTFVLSLTSIPTS